MGQISQQDGSLRALADVVSSMQNQLTQVQTMINNIANGMQTQQTDAPTQPAQPPARRQAPVKTSGQPQKRQMFVPIGFHVVPGSEEQFLEKLTIIEEYTRISDVSVPEQLLAYGYTTDQPEQTQQPPQPSQKTETAAVA